MAARAAGPLRVATAVVARHQAGRARRVVLPPDGVLRAGARAHARRRSGRGARAGRPDPVRAHQRPPVPGRPRGRALARPGGRRQPLREPPHHGRDRGPAAVRGLEGVGGGTGGQGGRTELRGAARPLAAGRASCCRRAVAGRAGRRARPLPGRGRWRRGGGHAAGERGQLRPRLA